MAPAMMMRSLALVALLSSAAAANPITAGVGVGMTQSKTDGEAGLDANDTIGLFGRLGFNKRISGQLEVTRIKTTDDTTSIRTGTALLVIDLATSGRMMPILLAGAGLDSASTQYGGSTDAHHFEGGVGLEYRADGGFTIGADLRIGGRSIDSQSGGDVYPLANTKDCGCSALYAPSTLQEGEYRSARLYAGVRF